MSADGSRALRILAAEIAQLGEADVQAILDDLDLGSRARLTGMIDAFRSGHGLVEPVAGPVSPSSSPGSWLLDRLTPPEQLGASGMTPHAFQALRRAALDSGWTEASGGAAPAAAQRGLLARLGLRP